MLLFVRRVLRALVLSALCSAWPVICVRGASCALGCVCCFEILMSGLLCVRVASCVGVLHVACVVYVSMRSGSGGGSVNCRDASKAMKAIFSHRGSSETSYAVNKQKIAYYRETVAPRTTD